MRLVLVFDGVPGKLQSQLRAMVEEDVAKYPSRFPMESARVEDEKAPAQPKAKPRPRTKPTPKPTAKPKPAPKPKTGAKTKTKPKTPAKTKPGAKK